MTIHEHKTLTCQGKVVFEKLVIDGFKRIPKIFQEKEACFMFVNNGNFLIRKPEQTIHFGTGDAMLSKCGNYYFENQAEIIDGEEVKTNIIGAYFYPELLKKMFENEFDISTYHTNYDLSKIKINSLLLNFKENIELLLDNPILANEVLIATKVKEFLLLLAQTENAPSVIDLISSLFKPYEYDFKKIIESNIYSNLSLDEYARLTGMSLSSFKRQFIQIFKTSPKKYISNRKIERAFELLKRKEKRISEIAFECGIDSISTFNRLFKSKYGKSPSNFRLNESD